MKKLTIQQGLTLVTMTLIGLIFFCLFTCSCSTSEQLTKPHFGDGVIIKVTEKEVVTRNYLGYEIPHYRPKNDTTQYVIDELLILNR